MIAQNIEMCIEHKSADNFPSISSMVIPVPFVTGLPNLIIRIYNYSICVIHELVLL